MKRTLELTQHVDKPIKASSLRVIANLLAASDIVTKKLMGLDLFIYFFNLMSDPDTRIRKEVCWATSNVAAGDKEIM